MNLRTVKLSTIIYSINIPVAWLLLTAGYGVAAVIVITFGSVIVWLVALGIIRA